MLTKETEALRFNNNKSRYSLIDFSMFIDMYKYFDYIQNLDTVEKCIHQLMNNLSIMVRENSDTVNETCLPLVQALAYKISVLSDHKPFFNSKAYDISAFNSMAKVMEYGAGKYAVDNWRKGYTNKFSSVDSLYRHLQEIILGNVLDEESGLPHIGHMMCNVMFLTNDLLYVKR